jgi:hypothetical protein
MYIANVARNMSVCDFNVINSVLNNGQMTKIKKYVIFNVIFEVKFIFKDIFGYFLEYICIVLSAFKSGPYS